MLIPSLNKTCLLAAVTVIGCTSSKEPLRAPDAGELPDTNRVSLDAAGPDLTAIPGLDAPAGGSTGIGAGGKTTQTGGTTGAGGAVGGATSVVVTTTGTGGYGLAGSTWTAAGTISTGGSYLLAGSKATGGQVFVAGTTSVGGALLAGITAGSSNTRTGGTVSTGGTTSTASITTEPPAGALAVYATSSARGSMGQLSLAVRIDNLTSQAVDLSNVTMRYWYQDETLGDSVVLDVDLALIGSSKTVQGIGGKVISSSLGSGADHYLELTLSGTLAAQGDTHKNDQLTLNVRLHTASTTGTVDVTNDYSYNAGAKGYNDKITLHSRDKLIWGTPPTLVVLNPDGGVRLDSGTLPDTNNVTSVTFTAGQAQGAMSGYGWVAMGGKDIVTSPTCGPTSAPITPTAPCSSVPNWDRADALCMSATIPALSSGADYADNWGIMFGVNTSDPIGPIGTSFSTLALSFTGLPQTGVQALLHLAGDSPDTTYCAVVTSGTATALGTFTTSCWNGTGTSLTAADAPKIDKIGLRVMSTSSEIIVDKLCLTGIVFGN